MTTENQKLRELADRFSEGWHDGIKIDASDVILLTDAADQLERLRAQLEHVAPPAGAQAVAHIEDGALVYCTLPVGFTGSLYTRPQADQEQAQQANEWRDMIQERFDINHSVMPSDPREAVLKLIRDEVSMALDPACSSQAEALIQRGRDEAQQPTTQAQEHAMDVSATWWSLVMGAAAAIEDAANCLGDEDAKRQAEGAAKHYRDAANKLSTAQTQAQELPDERATFERAMIDRHGWEHKDFMRDDFCYFDGHTATAWLAWQARAALAAKPVTADVRLWTWEHYAQLRHTRVTDPYGNEYLMMDSDAIHSNTIRLFHAMFTALNNAAIAAQGGK
jgi:hypothetical protein